MSRNESVVYREYRGIPGWVWILGIFTGVGAIAYLAYRYFIRPGDVILDHYEEILKDIYMETKQFLEENEADGIYGLTSGQEAILAAKQEAADRIRPEVERIIFERGWQLWSWVETAVIGIIVIVAAKELVPVLSNLVKNWRSENPEASANIESQYGHGHLVFEIVANEFAYAGKLNIASAFYNANIPHIYSAYTHAGLTNQINYYTALLPTLVPGTTAYIVAQQMLNYMTYEISTVTGIIPIMHTFWLPPPLLRAGLA